MASAHAIDLTKLNLRFQYDVEAKAQVQHKVTQTGDKLMIYLKSTLEGKNWKPTLLLQDGYAAVEHDTLRNFTVDTLQVAGSVAISKVTFDIPQSNLLVLVLADLQAGVYRVYDIRIRAPFGFPTFLPHTPDGLPVMDAYVTQKSLMMIGDALAYHVFQYLDDFGAADPAMGMMKPIAPNLAIDSSFVFENQLSGLEDFKIYLIQTDTMQETAHTVLKCPEYFPAMRRLEELVQPLTYITTSSENRELKENLSRKVFEDFWIGTYGSKMQAKTAIKVFYDAVEQANFLFTDYKQGWKTDRGMLYIIFGPPDMVIRSERTEIWRYLSGIEFEFIRISTLFTPDLYTLKRDRKYESDWYRQVGNLRKGL